MAGVGFRLLRSIVRVRVLCVVCCCCFFGFVEGALKNYREVIEFGGGLLVRGKELWMKSR